MERLDGPFALATRHLAGALDRGDARPLDVAALSGWPLRRELILAHETGLELGSPATGSLALVAWSSSPLPVLAGAYLIGPDLAESQGSAPFGRVALLQVQEGLRDEYALYLDVQDALAGTALAGVSVRARPSSQSVWYRFGQAALDDGLSLAHLGSALRRDLEAVDGVEAATILFVAGSREALLPLEGAAHDAARLLAALVKSSEEEVAECDKCDYSDICDESKRDST